MTQRIDTISPAFLIGVVAFAVWPTEAVLITATIGSWAVLTLLTIIVLALAGSRGAASSQAISPAGETSASIRERVVEAFANKAELLRQTGRTEEALLTYDELIRNGMQKI